MLLTKTVRIKWNPKNKKWYESKGYKFTKWKDEFEVNVEDLPKYSKAEVYVKCDSNNCNTPINKPIKWYSYLKCVNKDGKYYCNACSIKMSGIQKMKQTKLQKSKSFEQWCIDNNRQDVLDRWDYELNNGVKPNEICYGTQSEYYFKCSRGLHESELKNINAFTNNKDNSIECKVCNSFAQWGIDNICSDFLDKYWDWKKNDNLKVNPWEIVKEDRNKKVWIKCQNDLKPYHDSYQIYCVDFIIGHRCSYCANRKVHPLDSLGTLYPESLKVWSDKNKKSSYEYSPGSHQKVLWKCPEGKHEDYYRNIKDSVKCNFYCPECDYSKGENRIDEFLLNNNINYIPQKKFDNLIGLNKGFLKYDFYLSQYNLLIEYQGIQHEKPIDFKGEGKEYAEQQFKQQQEHDRRKREYAKNHNINLLEIWYWDFDNIEKILKQKLAI